MNDGIQDVIWRLTVRDPQGKIIYGPRVHLADKTMIAAAKRWDGKDVSLLREFAIRGAWQDMDAVPGPNHWSTWMTEEDRAAMTQPCVAIPCPPFKETTLTREPLSQDVWERRVRDYLGVEDTP